MVRPPAAATSVPDLMDLIGKDTLKAATDNLVAKATEQLVPALRQALQQALDGLTVEIVVKVSSKTAGSEKG